jgi:ribosomal protein S18 acetylase RimI-like enzyme
MPLVVRRVRITDLPVLESLEREAAKRFPARTRWIDTFRGMLETSLSQEPEGLLVADYDGRPVGAALTHLAGPHPYTGQLCGRIRAIAIAPGWRDQGIAERLLKEAEAYLRSRGCVVVAITLPSDAASDANLFKQAGFRVAGWELEKQ